MNSFTKCSVSLVTWSAMFINQVHAYLPPITFEKPGYVTGQSVTSYSGWNLLSGTASVSPPGTGFGGGQALKLPADPQQEPLLKRDIQWKVAHTTAFIDLQLKPAADPEGSFASFYANGTQLAFQVPLGGNTGEIWVYNGSAGTNNPAQWAKTVGTFVLASGGLTAQDYTRITLRHDYQRNIWDLFIGGKLAAANLAFEGRGQNLENLELWGSKTGDTLIDDLAAMPDNMLFPDADKDGMPTAWEIANGSNPNLYDRDNIKPGTGKSFLDLYMDSLWSGGLNGAAPLPPSGSIPPITILGNHQPVTSLKGSLSVGGDGSASYSMPIDIPKGTAGMEPKISLNYSSGGGNGIAGLGWSIGGLQSITRGVASAAKDGFAGTMNFDSNDRFSFNGERLVCISGTYGQVGSEYRTEIDSFARITLQGANQNSSSSWWKVETKAGLIIELGTTPDSKVLAPDVNAPITWDVARVSDTVGNYYAVLWEDTRTPDNLVLNDRRLKKISYTGNNAQNLAPYCHLTFSYAARPDKSFAYSPKGIRSENNQRLSAIAVSTGNQINHTYVLNYATSNQSGRSLLKSVLKQQPDGYTTTPTVFDWAGLKAGNARWAKSGKDPLPTYNGTVWDANLATINSVATTTASSVRLDGDASRCLNVPGGVNVTVGAFVEFDFRGENLDAGAYLIFDNNTTWNNSGEFPIRVKLGTIASPIPSKRELEYTAGSNNWQTFRVPLQGNANAALNLTVGSYPTLGFVNFDDNPANGSGYAEFRNVRVGTISQLDGGHAVQITFPETQDFPRFTANNGTQRGVRVMDINSDSLPDLVDARVSSTWTHASYELVPSATGTSGSVFISTGDGFVVDNSYLTPAKYPLSDNGGDGGWTTRFDMAAVPCDINGDGMLDLFVTELRYIPNPGTTSLQRYRFLTRRNGIWVEMEEYRPHFHSRTASSTEGGFWGWKHLTTKDLVDVDRDGHADLIIETTPQGWLSHEASTGTPKLLPENSRTVFLNRVHLGQGWVQMNNLAPPLTLMRSDSHNLRDVGIRLIDYDGDGFLDMLSASYSYNYQSSYPYGSNPLPWTDQRITRKLFSSSTNILSWNNPSIPATSSQDRPGAWMPTASYPSAMNRWYMIDPDRGANWYNLYPIPITDSAPFLDASGASDSGTTLIDLNGDGLVDINRSNTRYYSFRVQQKRRDYHYYHNSETCNQSWVNTGRETLANCSRWAKGAVHGGYTLPLPLKVEGRSLAQYTDLNGDGLVDILYATEGNESHGIFGPRATTPSDPFGGTNNGAFINTGTGWAQDTSWALPPGIRLAKSGTASQAAVVADINGDGFPDIIGKILDGQQPELWLNQAKPEVITSFTDGFGSQLQVEYRRLNDPTPTVGFGTRIYEKFSGVLPTGQAAVIDSRLVVSRYSDSNGMGGRNWKSQRYGDLRYDRKNESSTGFAWIEAKDETNGQLSRTENRTDFPFAGSPVVTTTSVNLSAADIGSMPPNHSDCPSYTPGRKVLSSDIADYNEMPVQVGVGGKIRRPVQTSSVKHLFDLEGTLKGETVTNQALSDFDAFGFVKRSTVTSLDNTSVSTSSSYNHNITGGKWHLGRLSAATVTKTRPGATASVKSSAFTYDTATGLLKSETIEPSSPLSVATNYTHDGFGNVTTTAVTADAGSTSGGVKTRTAASSYDTSGRFVTANVNSSGHTVSYAYDLQKALLRSTTDIGGFTTYFTYDPFGTQILTKHPDGTKTGEITGYATNASVPTLVKNLIPGHEIRFFRAKQASGTPAAKVYLDALGRELVTESITLLNATSTSASRYSTVYTVTQYDSQGRKKAVSEPFLSTETPNFTTIRYDLLSRIIETMRPGGIGDSLLEQGSCPLNGQPTTYSKTQNVAGQILERWENQHGQLAQSKDPSGQTTVFSYDIEGRMEKVLIDGVVLLTNTFDLLGNKTGVSETNSGSSFSQYNGFGEVVSSTNAKSQITTFSYDSLGRPASIAKPEGTYTTNYSNAAGSTLGKPLSITGSLGASGYSESFTYDSLGRPLTSSKSQFGETFTTSTVYDALGRVASATDAGGLTVFSEYDPTYSFPLKQTLAPGTYEGAGTVLWQAGTYDSKGRMLTQTLAQGVTTSATYDPVRGDVTAISSSWSGGTLQNKGYQWDNLGNLTSRTDNVAKRLESFGYDFLNRLTGSTISSLAGAPTSTVPPPQSYSYATNGNLLTKGNSATLTYANATKPHAVSSAVVKGFSRTYSYDAAGYVVSDTKRTYDWTSFGQLKKLTYNNAPELRDIGGGMIHSYSSTVSDFYFDAGGNRARQIKERTTLNDSRKIEDTLYLGSYERELHSTKLHSAASAVTVKTVHRHSLGGGMVYTRTQSAGVSGAVVKLSNILKDHLGSTDVILTGTWNGSSFTSQTTEFQSFDAWGERRDANSQVNYRAADSDAFRTSGKDYDRGYTGHEQLDDSGLIHMNGRIYDPELGRFLSPDPVVQIPEYSQNFNRYSYVLNNPLNSTDPSGFSFLGNVFGKIGNWIKENWRTIVVIVVAVVLIATGFGAWAGAALLGSAAGASVTVAGITITAAGAAAGAVVGAVMGGLSAALAGGDIGDILRGAVIGGIQGGISGGILHGMESSAVSFANKAAHVVGHGIVGGASNVAMGGKFQDGFLSAAAGATAGWAGAYKAFSGSGFGKLAGRTAVAGAVGGTASVLGGGKFANGAYTSAFQHLLNRELPIGKFAESMFSAAEDQLGIKETGGADDIRRIKGFHNSTTAAGSGAGIPWCASFVNWIAESLGMVGTNTAWAMDWLKWGRDSGGPVLGAVAVFQNKKGGGHVGFVAGVAPEGRQIYVLGGNQTDSVKYSLFGTNTTYVDGSNLKLLGYRVPNIPDRALIVAPLYYGPASTGPEQTR